MLGKEISRESGKKENVDPKDIVSYGLGGITATMTNQFKLQFHMNFLSDVAGLPIAKVGIWNMLLTIWDAINDPIIGRVADNTNTKKWGKYRPHMMIASVLLAITTLLMFVVPNFSTNGKLTYYVIILALFSIFSTQFTVPWQALNSVMSQDTHQRNLLLTSRQFVGVFATSAVGIFVLPVVNRFSNIETGWFLAAFIVGISSVLCGFLSANAAKKKDYYNSIPNADAISLREQSRIIFKSPPLLITSLLLGCIYLGISINSVINIYYLQHVVNNIKILPVMSLIRIISSLALLPFMPALMKRFGKMGVLSGSMFIYALPSIWLFVLREGATANQVILISSIKSMAIAYANVCCFALIPDCTDYTELHFGNAHAGFVNAVATFVRKFVGSFATLIVGVMLELSGYVANTKVSNSVVETILNINIFVPILLFFFVLFLVKLYPITPEYSREMRGRLVMIRKKRN